MGDLRVLKKILLILLTSSFVLILTSFEIDKKDWDNYLELHNLWKKERVANLKKPFGYLSMVGLFWLKEGNQSIGSSPKCDVIIPSELPDQLGVLNLSNGQIKIKLDAPIKINDEIRTGDVELKSDSDGSASMFNSGSHFWYVIKRGERFGIRMKDTLSESRLSFEQMPQFDPSPEWIVSGTFKKYNNQKIEITNKVGITYESDLAGSVSFEMQGEQQKLLATQSGEKLFIVFADETNGTETYGGGRFLYVDQPKEGNLVELDFNRAENPICALSDFATCPLPRPENYLKFRVEAGEKRVR